MSIKFFCKIKEKLDNNLYKVVLNAENINLIPEDNTTVRTIYSDYNLSSGMLVYVSDSELKSDNGTKTLIIKKVYNLFEIFKDLPQEAVTAISDAVKKLILDKDAYPNNIFTNDF